VPSSDDVATFRGYVGNNATIHHSTAKRLRAFDAALQQHQIKDRSRSLKRKIAACVMTQPLRGWEADFISLIR
jgi:hypothetical protein